MLSYIRLSDLLSCSDLFIKLAQEQLPLPGIKPPEEKTELGKTKLDVLIEEKKHPSYRYYVKEQKKVPGTFEGSWNEWERIDDPEFQESEQYKLPSTLPKIEPYHIKEPTGTEQKAISDRRLLIYNSLRKTYDKFYTAYIEANKLINEEIIEPNFDNLSSVEIFKNLLPHFIALIRSAIGKLFGPKARKRYESSSAAVNFFAQETQNIFSTDSSVNLIKKELNTIVDNFEKLKRFEKNIETNVQPAVDEFLGKQENVNFLNWIDKYNPEAKKGIVKSLDNILKDSYRHRSAIHYDYFKINFIKTIRTFSKTYNQIAATITKEIPEGIKSENKELIEEATKIVFKEEFNRLLEPFMPIINESINKIGLEKRLEKRNFITIDDSIIDPIYNNLIETLAKNDIINLKPIINYIATKDNLESTSSNYPYSSQTITDRTQAINVFKRFFLMEAIFSLEKDKEIDYNTISDFISKYIDDLFVSQKTIEQWLEEHRENIFNMVKLSVRLRIADIVPTNDNFYSKIFFISRSPVARPRRSASPTNEEVDTIEKFDNNLPNLSAIYTLISAVGGMTPTDMYKNLLPKFSEYNKDLMFQFVRYLIRQNKLDQVETIAKEPKSVEQIKLIFDILAKFNKFDINNITKYYETDMPFIVYTNILRKLPDVLKDKAKKYLLDSIRSLQSMETDVRNLNEIINNIHNSANDITPELFNALLINPNKNFIHNRDIARKFMNVILRIFSFGGTGNFKKDYGEVIKFMQKNKQIGRTFFNDMQTLLGVFESQKEINPNMSGFSEIKDLIARVSSEIELIVNSKEFISLFKEAKGNPKIPELYNINMRVNPRLRFRVFKDLDVRHFTIGRETECCQVPGGAAETSMRDSFINPKGGIVILEWLNNNSNWIALTQSWFHYVPEENGYILDNVETANKNIEESGVNIENAYALWANRMKKKLKLKYFEAGAQYSELKPSQFDGTESRDDDPRHFEVEGYVYKDWKPHNRNINLLKPKFKLRGLKPEKWGLPSEPEQTPEQIATTAAMGFRRMMAVAS